jgi:phosphodiesterase/alkaline phosphatase D-like protein
MSPAIDRRRFLTVLGGATAGLAVTGRLASPSAAHAAPDPGPFGLGVASGDPLHDSVVLWTRLGPDPRTAPVAIRWELADDERFVKIRRSGTVAALPENAHAVHVEVADLPPGRWFHYRFLADGEASRVGRTRTLPVPGSREPLKLAVASCQAWVGGPYPAYRDLAEQEPDLVFHLGDYIYETRDGSLEEFRRLYALYKSSPELRDAHAAAPFVVTWDDHEVQNNYAAGIAGGAGDGRPFLERRANAYKAFYEHLPLRRSAMPSGPDALIYRRLRWGKVAEFSVLDGRQYRSDQPCGDPFIGPVCGDEQDPARTMLGPVQERWLLDGLRASKARWNVLAQQTIMAPYDYDVGPGESRALDAWDGYAAARERILAAFAEGSIANPLVLAGDWHSTWVNDLARDGRLVGTEFAGTSISSGCGWDAAVRLGLPANPQVRFYEGAYRGYLLCTVSEDEWRTDMRIVLDARNAASPAYTLAAFAVADDTPGAAPERRDRHQHDREWRGPPPAQRAGRGPRRRWEAPDHAAHRRQRQRDGLRAARLLRADRAGGRLRGGTGERDGRRRQAGVGGRHAGRGDVVGANGAAAARRAGRGHRDGHRARERADRGRHLGGLRGLPALPDDEGQAARPRRPRLRRSARLAEHALRVERAAKRRERLAAAQRPPRRRRDHRAGDRSLRGGLDAGDGPDRGDDVGARGGRRRVSR